MEDAPETTEPETPAALVVETPVDPAPAAEGWAAEPWWEKIPEDVRPTLAEREKQYKEAMGDDAFYKASLANDAELLTLREKLADLEKTLGTKDEELRGYQTQAQERDLEARVDARARDLEARYPDVYADFQWDGTGEATGAFVEFQALLDKGLPEEKAAKMARALLPEKPAQVQEQAPQVVATAPVVAPAPPPKPVVPPSVAAMGNGAGPGRATVKTGTLEDAGAYLARMQREAELEKGGVG